LIGSTAVRRLADVMPTTDNYIGPLPGRSSGAHAKDVLPTSAIHIGISSARRLPDISLMAARRLADD